jgi:hypothetical protein
MYWLCRITCIREVGALLPGQQGCIVCCTSSPVSECDWLSARTEEKECQNLLPDDRYSPSFNIHISGSYCPHTLTLGKAAEFRSFEGLSQGYNRALLGNTLGAETRRCLRGLKCWKELVLV